MTSAVERFKMILANAFERVCILEEQLELAHARIQELEAKEEKDGGTEAGDRAESGPSGESAHKTGA